MSSAPGHIAGELGLVGLFDLGQLLHLNGATGCLTVVHEEGKGYLYFESGQIVNAVDESRREGEEVAYRIFAWKTGRFEFRPEAPSTVQAIDCGTEALMLEAARRMDEAAGVDQPGAGEAARLSDRKDSLEALREAFQAVARDARATGGPIASAHGSPHERLEDPRGRVLYRPGKPVRLAIDGRWSRAEGAILDGADYEALKASLREGAEPAVSTEPGRRHWRVRREGGRAFAIQIVGYGDQEALWVRALGSPPPDPARLLGTPSALSRLATLADAWVVAGAPVAAQSDHLLAALVRLRAEYCCETVVVVTEDAGYQHPDGCGVVVQVAPAEAEATIRALGPAAVAFEAACSGAAGGVTALDSVPVVLVSAVGGSLEALSSRWSDAPGATTWAGRERVVLYAPEAPACGDTRRAA